MRRALHIGLFIGTLIGMSACAQAEASPGARGPFAAVQGGAAR